MDELSEAPEQIVQKLKQFVFQGCPLVLPMELVSIIIPTTGYSNLTELCIQSVREHTPQPYEIVIIENGTPRETFKDLADQYFHSEELLGFPAACNRGVELASGCYIVLLNDDAQVRSPNWTSTLIDSLESTSSAIISPALDMISNPDQHIEHCKDKLLSTDHLMFVCVMMRKETYQALGGLDDSFGPGNAEDLDFCLRAKRRGLQFLVDGSVFVHHEGHRTFQKLFNAASFQRLIRMNYAKFIRKNQPEDFGSLAVGIPISRYPGSFFKSWTRLLIQGLRAGDTVIEPAADMLLHEARNLIVQKFLETGKETLLFIDSDSDFEFDAVEALRTDQRTFYYDIVQALVSTRTWPPEPIVMGLGSDNRLERQSDFLLGEVLERPRCGMAFTLIRRWVLEAVAEPWFEFPRGKGEDVYFCEKASHFGAKICVNTAIEIGHIMEYPVRWSDYLRSLKGASDGGSGNPNPLQPRRL